MNDNDYSSSYFKLDPEFLNKPIVPINEVYIFLKEKSILVPNLQTNNVFNKTLNYVERFNKFGIFESQDKAIQKIHEIRNILMKSKTNFTEVEKSQLMNLLPQKAEEAFHLIPSLRSKIEEDELQYYLDQMHKMEASLTYNQK